MKDMAQKMNAHQLDSGFIDKVMNVESFQGWFQLSQDEDKISKSLQQWFDSFSVADESEVAVCCHKVLLKLFSFLVDDIVGSNECICFEMSLRDFCLSEEFASTMSNDLPEALRGNRAGALYLADALKCSF